VRDPKLRHIHKAEVLDRVLHHAVMRIIEPIFEKRFIFDSYSSRKNKGTHKAVKRLRHFAWKLSRNNTKTVWVLKADIRKFFDSINHAILSGFLKNLIGDERAMALIEKIIRSFAVRKNKGIPLGNLTSQLFSNIYLNELDQFVKRELRERHYIRYADDFAIVGENPAHLENIAGLIEKFLKEKLDLEIHPQKIIIKKWSQGIDFLGYVALPHYTTLRTKTKRRIFKKIKLNEEKLKQGFIIKESFDQSLQSYYGILTHCSGYKLKLKLINILRQRKC
jgi:RNA-directed DNA polymerase